MPPSSLPPAKRRKTHHIATIEELENELTTAFRTTKSLNRLADLTILVSSLSEPQELHNGIYALYRVFVLIIDAGNFVGAVEESEESKVVRSWLNELLGEYSEVLCRCLQHEQKPIRVRFTPPYSIYQEN